MDEFARLMSMQGVRPLDSPKAKARKDPEATGAMISQKGSATPDPVPDGHAWVVGPIARDALDTALERVAAETRDGRLGWATGIRQDGKAITLPVSSGATALLGTADRQSLRLMVLGGDGWTFVMHPLMGVATLDEDPS
ncbi:hypothetical protein [Sphingomonas glaciei]|uniref:Uncharacterized protein n=1 Tax=Sphingomonas glaciei TaxID=2938948 RepID=A0ABY5MTR1_9SPHN|nr:hypothetical protein [Sphingomonas glaciei]UUR07884.1 hypothetical protein M1K48_13270 [Sphingomonas glaciei]